MPRHLSTGRKSLSNDQYRHEHQKSFSRGGLNDNMFFVQNGSKRKKSERTVVFRPRSRLLSVLFENVP